MSCVLSSNFLVILSSREICIVFMSKSSLCTFCSVSEKGNWCDLQEFDVSMDKVQNDILAVKKKLERGSQNVWKKLKSEVCGRGGGGG